jgi:CheY-like chemotaxis protein
VYLPRAETSDAIPDEAVAETPEEIAAGETLLLVEDDAFVREITVASLEELGYIVLAAESGEAALKTAASHEGPLHLLVTDVIMPGMAGPKVAEALQRLRPETKVLFVSGYTDDAMVHHGIREGEIAFLQKPFTLEALSRKIRETLGRT